MSAADFGTALNGATTPADKRAVIAHMREQLANPKFFKPQERARLYEAVRVAEDGILKAELTVRMTEVSTGTTAEKVARLVAGTTAQTEKALLGIAELRKEQQSFETRTKWSRAGWTAAGAVAGFLLPRLLRFGAEAGKELYAKGWDEFWKEWRGGKKVEPLPWKPSIPATEMVPSAPAHEGYQGGKDLWHELIKQADVRADFIRPECTINSKDAIPLSRPSTLFPVSPEP